MKTFWPACWCALALGGLGPQEPAPRAPEPKHTEQGRTRDALEGVYVLRTRTRNGVPEQQRSRGYIAITQRHLLLCLVAPGDEPEQPLVRAGVRKWTKQDDTVHTEIEMGFYTDADGEIHLEQHGKKEPRRVEVVRGLLRVWQDARDYLEFERVE